MDKLLPPEILCDIFLKNIPHNHEQDTSKDPLSNAALCPSVLAPLHASHVCRTWRHVSISCGELWSYLQISVDSKSWKCKTKRKRMLYLFDTWLSRTNGHPINYMFNCHLSHDGDIGPHRDAEYVITTLISQKHRWKDVFFAWISIEMSSEFPGLVLINMPMLTSLSLSLLNLRKSSGSLHATICIAKSSELKRLRLYGTYELDSGNDPIHSLTGPSSLLPHSFNRNFIRDMSDCLRFLRVAPNLTKFLFLPSPKTQSSSHWDNTEPVTVPRLRFLSTTPFVIDKLTLPSLEALSCFGFGRVSVSGIWRKFFQRSVPPLTRLDLTNGDADAFIPSLCLLPTLERLEISGSRISSLFFHELNVDAPEHDLAAGSRVVCPSLVSLVFRDLHAGDNDEACVNALICMAKSRAEVLGTCKMVEVWGVGDTNPRRRKIITDLVDDDLRCTSLRGRVIIHGAVYGLAI